MFRMIARGVSHGLFVAGAGGLGKSRVIQLTLADEDITPVLVNSHCTPLALYRLLYEHRTGQVVCSDNDSQRRVATKEVTVSLTQAEVQALFNKFGAPLASYYLIPN